MNLDKIDQYLTEKTDPKVLAKAMKSKRVQNAINDIIDALGEGGVFKDDKGSRFHQSRLGRTIYDMFK